MFIALKDLNYGTRQLKAGDVFDALPHDAANARLLVILGYARDVLDEAIADGRNDLRRRYRESFGREPDGRWGELRLQKELAKSL